MNVSHALLALERIWIFAIRNGPVLLSGERVNRHFPHITVAHEIVERLRQAALVGGKLIDQRPYRAQIVSQHRLARVHDRPLILRQRNRGQNNDDRDHDHQFQQRKSGCLPIATFCLSITSHCTSLHSMPFLSTSSARRKRSHRPTSRHQARRSTISTPNRLCPSSDRLASRADKPFAWWTLRRHRLHSRPVVRDRPSSLSALR